MEFPRSALQSSQSGTTYYPAEVREVGPDFKPRNGYNTANNPLKPSNVPDQNKNRYGYQRYLPIQNWFQDQQNWFPLPPWDVMEAMPSFNYMDYQFPSGPLGSTSNFMSIPSAAIRDPSGFGSASPGFDNAPAGFGNAPPGFNNAPPGFDNGLSGFDNAPLGFLNAPPGFDNSLPVFGNAPPGFAINPAGFVTSPQRASNVPALKDTFMNPLPNGGAMYGGKIDGGGVNGAFNGYQQVGDDKDKGGYSFGTSMSYSWDS